MNSKSSRRNFLRTAGQGIIAVPLAASLTSFTEDSGSGVSGRKELLTPKNNGISLNIRDFGAVGDGVTKDTAAIQQAIDRCWVLGGGEVIVPSGNYLTGAVALKSNVTLRLEKDAILSGSAEFADYPVMQVRWEGKWIQGHVGLIYAIDAENIGIVGSGKIAGNHVLGGRPNTQNPLRHPALIEPMGCKNIRFEGFSTDYHLMWSLHPTYCENIIIKSLTIRSTGGNGDGIDIDSCKNVRIDGCDIATGDDCISLKSGRGMEGYTLLRTTENVEITNCTFADSIFACIGIGSETSGGIRNVHIKNCRFTAAKTHAIYIKSRPGRGAFIENIIAEDLDVERTQGGFLRFNILASGIQDQNPVPGDEGIPTIKNFRFSRIRVKDVPVLVDGTFIHPSKPLDGFIFEDVSGTCFKGITLANIKKAVIRNLNVTGYSGPLIGINNVSGKGLDGAVAIAPPKIPDPVSVGNPPYQLK
ncbi:MAG: glycoside hydrolase family 28 protein [Bacteroidota bacterium]|nr:glycoside hydrolase family 28 protein [Bacteroidota bacterium]